MDKNLQSDRVTNPLMNYTPEFYRRDVKEGVEIVVRRRRLAAEIKRQQETYNGESIQTTSGHRRDSHSNR